MALCVLAVLLAASCAAPAGEAQEPQTGDVSSRTPQEELPPFTGRIVPDDSLPADMPLPGVQIFACSADGYSSTLAEEVTPDPDGAFTVQRPSEVIDVYLLSDQLPPGVGPVSDPAGEAIGPDELSRTFVLSTVDRVEMGMEPDDLEPRFRLLNAAGQELDAYYYLTYDVLGHWLDEEKGLVEVSGDAWFQGEDGQGGDRRFPVSCTVDVSVLDGKTRAERLDYWGVTDGVGFDGYAGNGRPCSP